MTRPLVSQTRPLIAEGGELLRVPATMADLNVLLEHPRALSIVRQLPSVQLHRVVCSLGRGDCAELLALATPEQVRELLDLDVWHGDRIDAAEGIDWLHYLATQLPEETAARQIAALDVELVGHLVQSHVGIYLLEEESSDEVPDGLYTTPDGWFGLALPEEGHQNEQLIAVLELLYRSDPEGTRRLLQDLIWELPTELEEWSLRWRNGRLQDLGFADPIESLALYAYLDPSSVRSDERTADRPLRVDPETSGRTDLARAPTAVTAFWQRTVDSITDSAERDRVGWALLALSNRCFSADRVHPAEIAAAQLSLEGLYGRLSLGLEHLSDGDLTRARGVLAGVALMRVARVGHSLALDLRRRALPAAREGRLGRGVNDLSLLDRPLAEQLAPLLRPRPLWRDPASAELRTLGSRDDLRLASAVVDRALTAADLARQLELLPSPLPPAVGFGDLYRTAVINRLLGRHGAIDRAALARFLDEHLHRGALDAAVPEQLAATPMVRELLEQWSRELHDQLGALDSRDLDLRFVGGLWLQR